MTLEPDRCEYPRNDNSMRVEVPANNYTARQPPEEVLTVLQSSKRVKHSIHSMSWLWPIVLLLIGCFLHYWLHLLDYSLPIVPTESDLLRSPKLFSGERSRLSLRKLTDLGPRVVGDEANDVAAPAIIMDELKAAQLAAHSSQSIKYELQKGSGAYQLEFAPSFTNIYLDVQNVVAMLEGSNSSNTILVNCHYDTVPTSDGASDDAITCAVMLELIRVLSISEKRLTHNVVFLFNGAEETPLQGSHLFLSHPWAKDARLVLNLEAAGLGGRAILFQSGPQNGWLFQYYARHAPHPHAQILGEELFQSGAIPSDTDFRIFRDFGKMPGLDFAFGRNGYVYHTKYDSEKYIPPGSHQHLGDNILALLRNLGHAPEVANMEAHSDGQMVYYDYLGWFLISYSVGGGIALNIFTIILSIVSIFIFMGRLSQWAWLPDTDSFGRRITQNTFVKKHMRAPQFIVKYKGNKKPAKERMEMDSAYVIVSDDPNNGQTLIRTSFRDEGAPACVETTLPNETAPKESKQSSPSAAKAWKELGYALGARIAGMLAVFLATTLMACIIDGIAKLAMPWYSNVWLIFPLYWCPGLAAYGLFPLLMDKWRKEKCGLSLSMSTQLNVIASQIPWTLTYFIMTCSGSRSSSILFLLVLSSSISNLIIYLTPLYLTVHKWVWVYLAIHIPALLFAMYLSLIGYTIVIPITARSGVVNGDLYIAVITTVFVLFVTSFAMPLMSLIRKPATVLCALLAFAIVMIPISLTTSIGHPYKAGPNNPAPQRYWIMHSERIFYDKLFQETRHESGYFVLNLDRNSPRTIPLNGRNISSLAKDCEDLLYCGLPLYMTRMIPLSPKSSWIPAPPPMLPMKTTLVLPSMGKVCAGQICTYNFIATGPNRMTLTFSPRLGVELVSWSVPSPPQASGQFKGRPSYYLHIVRGMGSKMNYEIELSFNVTAEAMSKDLLLDMGLAGNHIHHESARTAEFDQFLNTFPDWTQMTGWISSYNGYVF